MKLIATALLAGLGVLGAPVAFAQHVLDAPPVVGTIRPAAIEAGVDYQVVCAPTLPGPSLCQPQSTRVPNYMRLANWRLVGTMGHPLDCVLNVTYGYTVRGPWVTPACPGVFVAPNLRYGDAYNGQRLAW